jgi:hypothetical protein
MKKCTRCEQYQDYSCFYKSGKYLSSRCKDCFKKDRAEYYKKNNVLIKEKRKKYVEKNKEKVALLDKRYRSSEAGTLKRKENYRKNIEKHRENDRERYRLFWIKRRLSQIKSKSTRLGIDFDITEEWVLEQLEQQDWKCYWTFVKLDVNSVLFKPSFDRIDPDGGYTKTNVVMCSFFVNMGRNNATTEELGLMIKEIAANDRSC